MYLLMYCPKPTSLLLCLSVLLTHCKSLENNAAVITAFEFEDSEDLSLALGSHGVRTNSSSVPSISRDWGKTIASLSEYYR